MPRSAAVSSLIAYVMVLLYLTLVFHSEHRVSPNEAVNLVPLRSIEYYLRVGGWEMVVNIIGNLVAFFPVGMLLPSLREPRTTLVQAAFAGMALSLAIELLQYGSGRRVADLDDVLLNTAGAVLGYLLLAGCQRMRAWAAVRG